MLANLVFCDTSRSINHTGHTACVLTLLTKSPHSVQQTVEQQTVECFNFPGGGLGWEVGEHLNKCTSALDKLIILSLCTAPDQVKISIQSSLALNSLLPAHRIFLPVRHFILWHFDHGHFGQSILRDKTGHTTVSTYCTHDY